MTFYRIKRFSYNQKQIVNTGKIILIGSLIVKCDE